MRRLASISVDLDEIRHYAEIHGLEDARLPRRPIYARALPRFLELFERHGVRATFFVIGADLDDEANRAILREAHERGHELANHSETHLYDLTRQDEATIGREIDLAAEKIEALIGERPVGFRAPGYTVTEELLGALEARDYLYDSSVFPAAPYYAAKAAAMAMIRARGSASKSVLDHPRVLIAPREPYRVGARYTSRGEGLLELPIATSRITRFPVIGTFLMMSPPRLAEALVRSAMHGPHLNLEFHGVDLADRDRDGLLALAGYQPDLRVPLEKKLARFDAVILACRRAGYEFLRLDEAARAFA